jgi:hypothetical protein
MLGTQPAVICPGEEAIVVAAGAKIGRDSKKYQTRMMEGSAKIARIQKNVMIAILQGEFFHYYKYFD